MLLIYYLKILVNKVKVKSIYFHLVQLTMSKQMKFGFAGMALATVLLATVAVLPLRYAERKTPLCHYREE